MGSALPSLPFLHLDCCSVIVVLSTMNCDNEDDNDDDDDNDSTNDGNNDNNEKESLGNANDDDAVFEIGARVLSFEESIN